MTLSVLCTATVYYSLFFYKNRIILYSENVKPKYSLFISFFKPLFIIHYSASTPETLEDTNTHTKLDNPKNRVRPERSSQTDDEEQQQQDGVNLCLDELKLIEEKLDKVLLILPELDHVKARVVKLEEEKHSMIEFLQFMQEDLNELRVKVESMTANLQEANKLLEKFSELERRQIKQECYNRRNNIKFFGIKDWDKESVKDTEETLRNFLTKEMKIRQEDADKIQFERVHRIPTKALAVKKLYPRPIIAKVSFYQDKEFIKSHIKNIRKGSKYGVADDFPREVGEIRKDLQPVLKKARSEQKTAFFNVEKLLINGVVRKPNGSQFTVVLWIVVILQFHRVIVMAEPLQVLLLFLPGQESVPTDSFRSDSLYALFV